MLKTKKGNAGFGLTSFILLHEFKKDKARFLFLCFFFLFLGPYSQLIIYQDNAKAGLHFWRGADGQIHSGYQEGVEGYWWVLEWALYQIPTIFMMTLIPWFAALIYRFMFRQEYIKTLVQLYKEKQKLKNL